MTTSRAWSVALIGVAGRMVEVEAAIGGGLPKTVLVGLPDTSISEAAHRCKAAVSSSGLSWPSELVTINLSPATLPKTGSHYDLGIVSAVLAAAGSFPQTLMSNTVFLGELGLDGRTRSVVGILPALLAARSLGFSTAVVPAAQTGEAELVEGLTVWGVGDLRDLVEVLNGRPPLSVVPASQVSSVASEPAVVLDFADVVGQSEAKWGMEVAAAGRHHVLMQGPPGVGKTLLAERVPGLLPDLTIEESMEVSAVHSLSGVDLSGGLITRPPISAPHHSASVAALVGGGTRVAKPGAISLAHRGLLFLDEAPEFPPRVLEALRQPLEAGRITLGRSVAQVSYPARFLLVLAANPCPCGNAATPGAECQCAPMAIRRYAARLSGPILDRIDIRQQLRPLRRAYLKKIPAGESSSVIADRVAEARSRQYKRLAGRTNGEISGRVVRKELPLPECVSLLEDDVRQGRLSVRGVDKVLRLSWTVADLAGCSVPSNDHVLAALSLRQGGR